MEFMNSKNTAYRPDIDGLRAIAVMAVILFHAGLTQFSGGFVGVDVFFVISGFLITTILIKDQERGGISISKFYQRRAKRIMPVLFVVILATLPVTWMFLPPPELKSYFSSIAATATFSSNILFWYESGYWDTATSLKPLIHTWSLAVEEQYYIVFPLLVMAAWRLGRAWFTAIILALVAASLWFAEHYLTTDPMMSFYMLPSRAWELLVGSITALYLLRRTTPISSGPLNQVLSLAGLGMIVYAILTYTEQTPFPGINAALPVIGTALIIAATGPRTLVGFILGSKPFVLIGLISYSAYLWHQPILAVFKLRGFGEVSTAGSILAIALTLGLSVLSYRFVEKPVRLGASVFGSKPFTSTAVATIAFVAISGYGYESDGFPSRLDSVYSSEARATENFFRKKYVADTAPESDKPVVLIIGDSYLYNWSIGLSEIIEKSKYRIVSVSYLGCKFDESKDSFESVALEEKHKLGCYTFSKQMNDKKMLKNIDVVILASYRPFEYKKNQQRFYILNKITKLQNKTKLYVMGNYFQLEEKSQTTCMIAMFISKRDARYCIELADRNYSETNGNFESKMPSDFIYIDYRKLICGSSKRDCPYSFMGVPFMLDKNHVTATFAVKSMQKSLEDSRDYLDKIGLSRLFIKGNFM